MTDYLESFFSDENQEDLTCKPCQLKTPFTEEEISKAARSLKNNKSPGIDELSAEYLKYAPTEVHRHIANLLNATAETGAYPKELKQGILTPLEKPGKKRGPTTNLRPIILLSVLRKILVICLIRRCWDNLSTQIPLDQSAYQQGRSTTEQVAAVKLLAEKAITSSNYHIYLLLLDMSKAFDNVNRKLLLQDLQQVIDRDELHLLQILITDVTLRIKIGKELGPEFTTKKGIAQGDCLSAVLFIYYLAKTLNPDKQLDHNYTRKPELTCTDELKDHNYYVKTPYYFEIEPKYADDITWITTAKHKINLVKETIPETLQARDLEVNKTKTEEYEISRDSDDQWKSCKILGSLLDTEKDINRRKILTIDAYKKLQNIFESRKVSIELKVRTFNAYLSSVFLYNSELWSLNKKLQQKVDAFQRSLLRRLLGYRWPKVITNKELYDRTKSTPWSEAIDKRRLNWLGHLMRLHPQTPVRQALAEALRHTKKPQGRPQTCWLTVIKEDLAVIGINLDFKKPSTETIDYLENLTRDRDKWRLLVHHIVTQRRR